MEFGWEPLGAMSLNGKGLYLRVKRFSVIKGRITRVPGRSDVTFLVMLRAWTLMPKKT